jgi:uncharacterized protein (DUF488 family)
MSFDRRRRQMERTARVRCRAMAGRIYSVGYEGLTVAGLVERLRQNRIEEVVDVRASPYSRRPGFSKPRLAESLEGAGIAYRHEPMLGNAFRDVADFDAAMELMRAHLAGGEPSEAVARLAALAADRRIAVLCLENDQRRCHRQAVLEAALAQEPTLDVLPLF